MYFSYDTEVLYTNDMDDVSLVGVGVPYDNENWDVSLVGVGVPYDNDNWDVSLVGSTVPPIKVIVGFLT